MPSPLSTMTRHTNAHSPTHAGLSSGKQERSSCELHSSVQIEGDTGRLVNRHRCTELSRTESGRKRKVTLSQWEGSDKVNNTCCVTKATVKHKKLSFLQVSVIYLFIIYSFMCNIISVSYFLHVCIIHTIFLLSVHLCASI